jgi:3-phenylpropionate/trans-cinnamate dioxygenase ferredoxin reductase subunit
MQVAGVSTGDEEIVRGEVSVGAKFSLIQLQRGRAVGVTCVNNVREFSSLKRLLGSVPLPDRAALADASIDLRKLLAAPEAEAFGLKSLQRA